jgi:hypothetical protein
VADTSLEYAESAGIVLNARTLYVYAVEGLRPLSAKVVTFAPVSAISVNPPPGAFLSILYPSSPVALSLHVKAIWVEDWALAERPEGASKDDTASYAFILPPLLRTP